MSMRWRTWCLLTIANRLISIPFVDNLHESSNASPGGQTMKLLGLLATVVGLVLMVISFLWTTLFPPVNQWSDEKAKEHQKASATYHELQHTVGGRLKGPAKASRRPPPTTRARKMRSKQAQESQPQPSRAELEAAKKHWEEIELARLSAHDGGEQPKWWLRLGAPQSPRWV